jgi:diguanylate cyclase (GGDEF)-like protein
MNPTPADELVLAREACGMSQEDLWMRYFALGGMSRPLELDAIVHGALRTTAQDRDLVVLALNERFSELGRARPIGYSDDPGLTVDDGVDAVAYDGHDYRDVLTGALQRGAGGEQLQRAVHQAHRTHHPLTLVFVDVDHLKHTNDTHGHAAGDAVLEALGEALRETLRSYDVVVRYGGDEFVCALPHADVLQATRRFDEVAANLSAAVAGATVSAGYAALREGESLYEVLRRADEDMYDNRRRHRSDSSEAIDEPRVDAGSPRALWARVMRPLRAALARAARARRASS